MIEQVTTIMFAMGFGSLTAVFTTAVNRYLTMKWTLTNENK